MNLNKYDHVVRVFLSQIKNAVALEQSITDALDNIDPKPIMLYFNMKDYNEFLNLSKSLYILFDIELNNRS